MIDFWALEQRNPPTPKDITKAVKKAQGLPDAGDHEHVLAMFPIYNKALPPIPTGSWEKYAKQKPVKLKKLKATNQQLNRTNLIWHLRNPGKARYQTPHNTHPQVLKTKDGDLVIVDGHHRLSAEQMLGVKKDMTWLLDEKDL